MFALKNGGKMHRVWWEPGGIDEQDYNSPRTDQLDPTDQNRPKTETEQMTSSDPATVDQTDQPTQTIITLYIQAPDVLLQSWIRQDSSTASGTPSCTNIFSSTVKVSPLPVCPLILLDVCWRHQDKAAVCSIRGNYQQDFGLWTWWHTRSLLSVTSISLMSVQFSTDVHLWRT